MSTEGVQSQYFSDIEDVRLEVNATTKAIASIQTNIAVLDGPGQEELTFQQGKLAALQGGFSNLESEKSSALGALSCSPQPLSTTGCVSYSGSVATRYSLQVQSIISDVLQWEADEAEIKALIRQYGPDESLRMDLYVAQAHLTAADEERAHLNEAKGSDLAAWGC